MGFKSSKTSRQPKASPELRKAEYALRSAIIRGDKSEEELLHIMVIT